MEDVIDYKVPFGILGQLVQPLIVKPKLEEVFNYRREQLEKLFGKY
jgi:ligand-binding SRPBCC domain-containing protein